MKGILFSLLFIWLLIPVTVLAQEEQFIISLNTEIVSKEDCLAKILENDKKILSKLASLEGELSGSAFYAETAKINLDAAQSCQASLQIVSDKFEVTNEKIIAKKEWKCSAAAEQPKYNGAGQPSCASVLLEVKKEADRIALTVSRRGDVFLKEFAAGREEIIEHREPSNIPWWYYLGALLVMVVIFPAITVAYGHIVRRKDNKKSLE